MAFLFPYIPFFLVKMTNIKILFLLLTCSFRVHGQYIVRGKILDKINGEPLQYAVISPYGRGTAVTSDREGYFQLNMAQPADSLMISMIGYRSQTLGFNPLNKSWIIRMERGPVDLQT